MRIIWNGHACFSLECQEGTLVFDPFEDGSIPGIRNLSLEANCVLCSHQHYDHNAVHTVTINEPKDFHVDAFDSYHDDQKGALRGKNTIHLIHTEGMRVVHLGDLGHMPECIDALKNCDVLMIPVGGHYTIDSKTAKEVIDAIDARIVIPMHYRTDTFGFDVISHIDEFIALFENITIHNENFIEITNDTKKQIAILTYK